MTRQFLARHTLIAAVLILGVGAWIVVGGVVLVDSIHVVTTPTAVKVSIKPASTTLATSMPTSIPATVAPTLTPTTLAVVPTVDAPTATEMVSIAPATEAAPSGANGCNTPADWVAY